jgi:hypothetical protein
MLRDDLMKGAEAAAQYSGLSARNIYGLCEKEAIPFVRVGGCLYFRKSELELHFSGTSKTFRREFPLL